MNKIFYLSLAITLFFIVSISKANNPHKPSFDCSKAVSNVDQLVCKDTFLGSLDWFMAKYYKDAQVALPMQKQKTLLIEQLTWLKNRNKSCNIPNERIDLNSTKWWSYLNCLRANYKYRNYQLFLRGIPSATQSSVVKLTGKIEFSPFDVTGELSKATIKQLYKTEIIVGGYQGIHDPHVIYNCEDMKKYQAMPDNSIEVSEATWIDQVCTLLDMFDKAKKPKESYIQDISLSDIKYLPLSFLPTIVDEDDKLVQSYQKRRLSISDLVKKGVVEVSTESPSSVEIHFAGSREYIHEIARADFLDSGYDSILVKISTHVDQGTMWHSQLSVLTREKNDLYLKEVWSGAANGD